MKICRCAVVGVGYLGRFHAQKYASLPQAELVAVVDSSTARAQEVANEVNCEFYNDINELIGKVDAVSIVTPTKSHYQVAKFFITHGIHVFIEKPITAEIEQAEELIALSKKHNVLIQVGHLERFNSAILAIEPSLSTPKYIEAHRVAPFNLRGSDVNVILDLMIHDIDLVSYLIKSPIKSIAADGAPVLTQQIDIANTRIEFENGSVANITVSRAGLSQKRQMRIYQEDALFSVDLYKKTCAIYRKGDGEMFPGIPDITLENLEFSNGDAIKAEIEAFIDSIVYNKASVISGQDGLTALMTAKLITQLIKDKL